MKNFPAPPLAGIRVLDLTRILAGPWATQLLADFGAEVIKVEHPAGGDETRRWGPPWVRDARDDAPIDAAYFHCANRNKRSITVNFADARGREIVERLAGSSDVLVENFRPGSLAQYGLDAASLLAQMPSLVYCSITAYGQAGTRARAPGFDAMIQATGGLMSITGEPDGEPQKVGVAVADLMAGMYAASAVLAALHARERTGRGQHIDVALYDSQVAWLANQGMNWLVGGTVPRRLGNAHPNIVPYQVFATADGHLMVAVGNERQFRALAACIGRPELATSPKFADNAARVENRDELVALLAAVFRARPTAEWDALLARHGVPAGPINDLAEVFSGPQAHERELVRRLPHPRAGDVPTIANPVRFSGTPVRHETASPTLGQHTDEVLAELGYPSAEIAALRADGVV
ncbi:MAG TPA: CaiB/BaiF CoA-transferase family protein [Woeseiaceae bacterium]|nr:CaiB/BaiF CoA-transferase family protein [Woeseiaceae bacterium]